MSTRTYVRQHTWFLILLNKPTHAFHAFIIAQDLGIYNIFLALFMAECWRILWQTIVLSSSVIFWFILQISKD